MNATEQPATRIITPMTGSAIEALDRLLVSIATHAINSRLHDLDRGRAVGWLERVSAVRVTLVDTMPLPVARWTPPTGGWFRGA